MEEIMVWIWLGVIVLACLLEVATASQLVSIWAAVGGLAAMISNFLGAGQALQIVIFFVVTLIALALTRPLVKKLKNKKTEPTNADMCIGQIGKVISKIQGGEIMGQVRVSGTVWTAVSDFDGTIPEGAEVRIKRIEGVKLIVEPVLVSLGK